MNMPQPVMPDYRQLQQMLTALQHNCANLTPPTASPTQIEVLHQFDARLARVEKQVETVLSTMYTLVQLQTTVNQSMTQFRDECSQRLRTISEMVAPDGC